VELKITLTPETPPKTGGPGKRGPQVGRGRGSCGSAALLEAGAQYYTGLVMKKF